MYLGAGFSGQRLSKLYRESVNEAQILEALAPIFFDYATNRFAGERFGDFTVRQGYVLPTLEGKDFHKGVGIGYEMEPSVLRKGETASDAVARSFGMSPSRPKRLTAEMKTHPVRLTFIGESVH